MFLDKLNKLIYIKNLEQYLTHTKHCRSGSNFDLAEGWPSQSTKEQPNVYKSQPNFYFSSERFAIDTIFSYSHT